MSADARLVPASSPAWVEALRHVPTDVFHLPHYAIVDSQAQGGWPAAFTYRDGGERLLIPLVVRRVPDGSCSDAISPYGYGGPTASTADPTFWREALTAFQDALLEVNVIACLLRLHPLMPAGVDALKRVAAVVEHGQTVSLDLAQDAERVTAGIRTNHRRDIQRARGLGHQGVVDDWTYLPDFLDMYDETMDRVHATEQYRFSAGYVPSLRRALGEGVHLITVVADGRAIASGVFFESGGTFGYHLGATRTDALSLRPSKLMMDTAWRWAQRRGNHTFHLGGGVGGSAEDPLFHFKAGFSHRRHTFRTARLVLDGHAYEQLCPPRQNGSEEATHTGYFPAYRSPGQRDDRTGKEGGPWLLSVT